LLDYVLTHFIISDNLKEFINTIVWIPWASFAVATGVFLVIIGILTVIIRISSFVVKSRIFMGDAFVITAWAFLPIIFLLVMTSGLYRLLTTDTYTTISLLLILYIMLWCLYRMFRGVAVIYDVRALNVYIVGVVVLAMVLVGLIFYYDTTRSTIAFGNYFFSVLYR
jgi:hypothetical protein